MNAQLILSVGMPRAGSGWHYNLVHDLIVASGGRSAREIRQRFLLKSILTEVNCNVGVLSTPRVMLTLIPVVFGNTYAIKAHAGPRWLVKKLIHLGKIKATYIYRDPRDALLSTFEYGQRMLQKGGTNAFSSLTSIEKAIGFMADYVRISEAWLSVDNVLQVRYEDMLLDYDHQVNLLLEFLGLNRNNDHLGSIIDKYQPDSGSREQKGLHFVKGKIGRFRDVLTPDQIEDCDSLFGDYLRRMGYQ